MAYPGFNRALLRGFQRVIQPHATGLSVNETRVSTGLSERLVQE
jgi:hypothetical protein